MRIGILTSTAKRHIYFATELARNFEVAFVLQEPKMFNPGSVYENETERLLLTDYFDARDSSEHSFFGACDESTIHSITTRINPGELNNPETIMKVKQAGVDAIAVFGSSILGDEYLDSAKVKYINIHLGLSPYYRGSGTNFFPFVNGEISCVGATVHEVTSIIDGGEIYHQVRPEVGKSDTIHDIGNKTIIAGTAAMIRTLNEYEDGSLRGFSQTRVKGSLYRRKDFSATAVKKAMNNVNDGLIHDYLRNKTVYDNKYPLIG